ncbi:MAG TPA: hypothetical protein VK137_17695, partial [Planctomycetaceae bacterium]|nr:hypothetical protein [Planctomycetaceae bacterium]
GPITASSAQLDIGVFDRKGSGELLKLPPRGYEALRISPDGKQIVVGSDDGKEAIVWIYDLAGSSAIRRLTFGGRNRFPVWSADGQRVTFQSDREGDLGIFWQRADGTGPAERLTKAEPETSHVPQAWSPKGDTLLFDVMKSSNVSLWTLNVHDKKTTAFDAITSAVQIHATFSPDGHWVTYSSRGPEQSRNVVYVQSFPPTGAKYQISTDGGLKPVWSRDGKEIFYSPGPGDRLAVVRIAAEIHVQRRRHDPAAVPECRCCASQELRRHFGWPIHRPGDCQSGFERDARRTANSCRAQLARRTEAPRADSVTPEGDS